jgi:hypothetical protein
MWQSGHVQLHNKWVPFDEVPERTENIRALKAYRRVRERAPQTVEGQLALAEWCAEQKLPLRTRAHLNQVIELDPDHELARRLLGFQRIDGQWLDADQIEGMRTESVRLGAALTKWQPKLADLLSELASKQLSRRDRAREELGKIDDPDAVPAIELILARHSEEIAALAVELLNRIDTVEAVEAITRLAIYSPWESVQQAAVEQLKPRDPAAYAPMLLGVLEAPLKSDAEFVREGNGQFVYRHMIYREGQEDVQATVHETNYPLSVLSQVPSVRGTQGRRSRNSLLSYGARQEMMNLARLRDATLKAASVEANVAQQNLSSQQRNVRVCAVLSAATGVDLPAKAEDWWEWWTDYNEYYTPGEKPVNGSRSYETARYRDPYRTGQYARYDTPYGPKEVMRYAGMTFRDYRPPGMSCLLAGTLVWTESGHVPIEDVQVGDLVLSQDPDSGTLAYKPVLKTTVRPPTRAYHVRTEKADICSSGGHAFWVAGEGWQFARDIKAPMRLHTVAGTTVVEDAEQQGVDTFHNLVVADLHTYFVTKSNILTHDNTTREATDCAVPGLVKQ